MSDSPGVSRKGSSIPWSDIIFEGIAAAGTIATLGALLPAAAPATAAVIGADAAAGGGAAATTAAAAVPAATAGAATPDVITGADVAANAVPDVITGADAAAAATSPPVAVDAGTSTPTVATPELSNSAKAKAALKVADTALKSVKDTQNSFQENGNKEAQAVSNPSAAPKPITLQSTSIAGSASKNPYDIGLNHYNTIFGAPSPYAPPLVATPGAPPIPNPLTTNNPQEVLNGNS